MRSLETFIAEHNVTADIREVTPDAEWFRPGNTGRSFRVMLQCDGRTYTVPFHQGSGIERDPEVADVLGAVAMDAQTVENASGFWDWARDLYPSALDGDEDEEQAGRKIYDACRAEGDGLTSLLGVPGYLTLVNDTYHDPGQGDDEDEQGDCDHRRYSTPDHTGTVECVDCGAHIDDPSRDDYREATPREASAYLAGHRSFPGAVETDHGLMIPTDGQEQER